MNPYEEIKQMCVEKGISMRQACKWAGVDQSVLNRWKNETPKSIDTFNRLKETINKVDLIKTPNTEENV